MPETAAGKLLREAFELATNMSDDKCRQWLLEHDPAWLARFDAERAKPSEGPADA